MNLPSAYEDDLDYCLRELRSMVEKEIVKSYGNQLLMIRYTDESPEQFQSRVSRAKKILCDAQSADGK